MGINLEYCLILNKLHEQGLLKPGGSVLEFGAQDISADPLTLALCRHGERTAPPPPGITSAQDFYASYGLTRYTSIDATAAHGALAYDCNLDLTTVYGFSERFDLVTDIGTFEHCFNISTAFGNAHRACLPGGVMIHALPAQGNANHGFYNIHPTLFDMIASANNYNIIDISFTVDYAPKLYEYNMETYRLFDDRDILIYYVLLKQTDTPFEVPFDGIFAAENKLVNYSKTMRREDFSSYIKGSWANVSKAGLGRAGVHAPTPMRRIVKKAIDWLGSKK